MHLRPSNPRKPSQEINKDLIKQEKETARVGEKLSHNYRQLSQGAEMAGKTPTTTWDLLKWAYARQQVRYSGGNSDSGNFYGGVDSALSAANILALGATIQTSGSGHGALCHDDALTVDQAVRALCKRSDDFWLMVNAAEGDALPDWDPPTPDIRFAPVLKGNGKPDTFYPDPKRHDISACMVRQLGMSESEKARWRTKAHRQYARFTVLLASLTDTFQARPNDLTAWQITAIGIPRRPWSRTRL